MGLAAPLGVLDHTRVAVILLGHVIERADLLYVEGGVAGS